MSKPSPLRPAWPLAVCVAVALLWPMSELLTAHATATVGNRIATLRIGPGWFDFDVAVDHRHAQPLPAGLNGDVHRMSASDRRDLTLSRVFSSPGAYHFWSPLWFVTLGAALFAAGLLVSRVRKASISTGHCRQCGYDLRASPDRCPECGSSSLQAGKTNRT